jgi:hypothetical protein
MRLHQPAIPAHVIAALEPVLGAINFKRDLSIRPMREEVDQDERAGSIIDRLPLVDDAGRAQDVRKCITRGRTALECGRHPPFDWISATPPE